MNNALRTQSGFEGVEKYHFLHALFSPFPLITSDCFRPWALCNKHQGTSSLSENEVLWSQDDSSLLTYPKIFSLNRNLLNVCHIIFSFSFNHLPLLMLFLIHVQF